ncbi:bestrophin family protein [Mucilaginibacter terrae]|uniref:bestrophin family protein n=1 Tax=Mucilaginibacter terrae TaxID=1955052 RepID=UPI003638AA8B
MLIKPNFKLIRILKTTWKVDILMLLICGITFYIHEYVTKTPIQLPVAIATLLGTAIAFFVGFSNNQAYDRWWEARTIWGGLVNDSRSWARNILHNIPNLPQNQDLAVTKKQMIRRHIGFVYALKESLRGKKEGYFKTFLRDAEQQEVTRQTNVPNAVIALNAIDLQQLSESECIDGFRFMQLNQLLTRFTDHMGKCERIKNTVFPTSYVVITRLFIFIMIVFTTLILTESIGAWAILISWILGFVFHITHQNGMYLMNPFEEIATGIPLNQIARTIEINLLEMLGEKDIPPAEKPVNDEYFL